MPAIAIQPLPAAPVPPAANPGAADATPGDAFQATLDREIEARRHAQQDDAEDTAPSADATQAAATPAAATPAEAPPSRPADASDSAPAAADVAAAQDGGPLPGATLIPVMQALERLQVAEPVSPQATEARAAGVADTSRRAAPGAALRAGTSPEGAPGDPRIPARSAALAAQPAGERIEARSAALAARGDVSGQPTAERMEARSATLAARNEVSGQPAAERADVRSATLAARDDAVARAADERFDAKVATDDFAKRLQAMRADASPSPVTAPVLAPAAARPDAGALPPAQVSASIPQDVGSAAWARSLGQHIAWQAAGNYQTAELHLHPADLGPLQVVLSVENNQADLSFVSREPAVRAAIEAAMPELRAMLAESGISLGQAHVGAESPRDQPQFEPPRQRAGHDAVGTEAAVSGGTLRLTPGRGGAGLVDVFA